MVPLQHIVCTLSAGLRKRCKWLSTYRLGSIARPMPIFALRLCSKPEDTGLRPLRTSNVQDLRHIKTPPLQNSS